MKPEQQKEHEQFLLELYGEEYCQKIYGIYSETTTTPSKSTASTKKNNGIGKLLGFGVVVIFLICAWSQPDTSIDNSAPLTQKEIREQCKEAYGDNYQDYLWCMRIVNLK